MAKLLLLAFVCISGVSLAWSSSWNYIDSSGEGPKNWTGVCASGTKQSPIDINSTKATYKSFADFNLQYFSTTPAINFTGTNNGHTVKISVPTNTYFVNGGGLSGNFTTAQFHLHWGSSNSKGSEHLWDGKQHPAEIHFVNFNTKYPNLTYAADKSDGLAVLGVCIKIGSANAAYDNIFTQVAKLVNESSTVDGIAAFNLANLLPNISNFYRYEGSLTTPGCYESVTWTVFSECIEVSSAKMTTLRQVKMNSTYNIENNFRPAQALNSRTVYVSYKKTSDDDSTATAGIPTQLDTAVVAKITTSLLLMMLFGALVLN